MMPHEPTVFVVDDDDAVRRSSSRLLASKGYSVEAFASADEFLSTYKAGRPGCLLLDVAMPGMDGLELQEELNRRGHLIPIIMVTAYGSVPKAVRSLKGGAIDFIEKPFKTEMLLDLIEQAFAVDVQRRARQAEVAEARELLSHLTDRERQVSDLLVSGLINKEIAVHLGISPKTVEIHRAHVMTKLRAESLAEVVRMVTVVAQHEQEEGKG